MNLKKNVGFFPHFEYKSQKKCKVAGKTATKSAGKVAPRLGALFFLAKRSIVYLEDNFMEMVLENRDFLDNYLGLINGLSRESKIKLVERINVDIKKTSVSETDWIDRLYGSFISDKSAEMMISEIRADRRFNREIVGF